MFQRDVEDKRIIIIQCDSGHKHIDLIACARYRVIDEKAQSSHRNSTTHVVFVIGLPRKNGGTKFVSFQGGKWKSYHVDNLMQPSAHNKDGHLVQVDNLNFTVNDFLTISISELLNDAKAFRCRLQHCLSLSYLSKSSNVSDLILIERFTILSQLVKRKEESFNSHANGSTIEDEVHQNSFSE